MYTETLKPTPNYVGNEDPFSLQVVPQVCSSFSIYAVSYFHFSGSAFGTTDIAKTKDSWLFAQDKLLVDISPLVFQLNSD